MVLTAECRLTGATACAGGWLPAVRARSGGRSTGVLARPVTVKLLHDEHADDGAFVSCLRAEARHAAEVSHPGIASVFDYGEADTPIGPGRPPSWSWS